MKNINMSGFVRRRWIMLLVFVGIIYGAYYFWNSNNATEDVSQTEKTAEIKRGDLRVSVSGSGQIQARSQVDLKPVIAGDGIDVMDVKVKNDQEVKKGQVIAVLDTEDAARDIENAELELKSAKIKQKQVQTSFPGKTIDDARERQSQTVIVKQKELAFSKAQSKLRDYYIKAPFDGIVTGLSVEAGDSLSRDTVLASVITKEMKAVISLNEVDAAKVKEGYSAVLSFDALPALKISGSVIKLDTIGTIQQGVVSYGAEIELSEQNVSLKPGMSLNANIVVVEKIGVLLVPNSALTVLNGVASVNVMNKSDETSSTGENREVKIGLTDEVNTEVLDGLKEGDVVLPPGVSGTSQSSTSASQRSLLNLFPRPGQQNSRSSSGAAR